MVTTEVVNDTDGKYVLKEGTNIRNYRILANLESNGGKYLIKFDPNDTYRSYWVGTDEKGNETTFNSDDCMENSNIVVKSSSTTGKVELNKIIRGSQNWTEVLNKSGYKCSISKFTIGALEPVSVGKLKEEDGRFFILSDDPENAELKFSKYRVEVKPLQKHIDIPSEVCKNNKRIFIEKDGDKSVKLQLDKHTSRRGSVKSKTTSSTRSPSGKKFCLMM